MNTWQDVIWREWRHSRDPVYADRLFRLVSGQSLGIGGQTSVIILNAIGGAALGVLVGLLFTSSWATLKHMVWLGGLLGIIYGWILAKKYTWRDWLERLSSNTPTGNFSKIIISIIALGAIGGMVFGPIFWLSAVGLFWAFGDVITWINRGVNTSRRDGFDDRRWWFWWRKRPHVLDVEQALQQAQITSLEAQELWQAPLRRLAEERKRKPDIEMLINQLSSPNWTDRFVARQIIVQHGKEAIFPIQTAVHNDNTPHKATLLWVLENLHTKRNLPARSPINRERS
ncbi:MAG: hypothetical protein KDJ65_11965 [Anaerolineae bacterium]|nr:hypothetical protein [Anaerolineae bacterium]